MPGEVGGGEERRRLVLGGRPPVRHPRRVLRQMQDLVRRPPGGSLNGTGPQPMRIASRESLREQENDDMGR
jgi:hypothetical protein